MNNWYINNEGVWSIDIVEIMIEGGKLLVDGFV